MYGHYNTLKWLLQHEIYPSQKGVNKSSMTGSLDLLKLLASFGFYPDQHGANYTVGFDYYDILDWLIAHNIKPDKEYATEEAIQNEDIQKIKWLDAETSRFFDRCKHRCVFE